MATTYSPAKFQELRDQLSGAILLPGDPGYAEKRLAWNRSVDQYPALIVMPEHVQDVQAAVRFADAHNLGIAVQLTGHGIKYAADDNMLILTAKLNVVTPHGLAPLMGTSPAVGVVGYTLGGGVGWLARRYGLAIDSVHWIELVT